jgi:hypothetical protein
LSFIVNRPAENQASGTAIQADGLDTTSERIDLRMLEALQYRLSEGGLRTLREYIPLRMRQPHFAKAIEGEDLRTSRVFS